MMKKMLCLLLALMLCPIALAEENSANMLGYGELTAFAADYIARALEDQPLNVPAENPTPEGYEYIYPFATLYADTPTLGADSVVSAIVLTDEEEKGPRGVQVGSTLDAVLAAYYTENENLSGTKESAVLYASDFLPESAAWGQVLRDGQRIKTVQYAVHEQLAAGGDGYTDAGVIYTMADNRVAALRVYGLNSRASLEDVNAVMFTLMMDALYSSYTRVPFSYDGSELTPFGAEDLVFSGLDFLALTPDSAIALLGEPMSDTWVDNGGEGYIRVQKFAGCELTWLFDGDKTQGKIYMLEILVDGLEGPRGVRVGDSFASVYNRFRNGEGEYQPDGVEMLYGNEKEGAFGEARYEADASATLRYGLYAADHTKIVLEMTFSVMTLSEIRVYCE